jgi:hypothetical protein
VADLRIEPVAPVEQGADLRGHRFIVRIGAPFMSGTARQLRDGWSGTGIPYTGGDHASRRTQHGRRSRRPPTRVRTSSPLRDARWTPPEGEVRAAWRRYLIDV